MIKVGQIELTNAPLRSLDSHFVKTRGLRWLSLMLLANVPWAGRVWALPFHRAGALRALLGKAEAQAQTPHRLGAPGCLELLYSRCAGPDVHKKRISACIRISRGGQTQKHTAVFGTFTADLERLCDWLRKYEVSHVACESTGVFWIPVWNVLERWSRSSS